VKEGTQKILEEIAKKQNTSIVQIVEKILNNYMQIQENKGD